MTIDQLAQAVLGNVGAGMLSGIPESIHTKF